MTWSTNACAGRLAQATSFLRSDELPGRPAVGYLDDKRVRTNVLHPPVRSNRDGGIYTTAADVHAPWDA
jgi:hypothetical protein